MSRDQHCPLVDVFQALVELLRVESQDGATVGLEIETFVEQPGVSFTDGVERRGEDEIMDTTRFVILLVNLRDLSRQHVAHVRKLPISEFIQTGFLLDKFCFELAKPDRVGKISRTEYVYPFLLAPQGIVLERKVLRAGSREPRVHMPVCDVAHIIG